MITVCYCCYSYLLLLVAGSGCSSSMARSGLDSSSLVKGLTAGVVYTNE